VLRRRSSRSTAFSDTCYRIRRSLLPAGDEDLVLADEAVIADPANVHPGRARFRYRVKAAALGGRTLAFVIAWSRF
jgi:hypothetical protein